MDEEKNEELIENVEKKRIEKFDLERNNLKEKKKIKKKENKLNK